LKRAPRAVSWAQIERSIRPDAFTIEHPFRHAPQAL